MTRRASWLSRPWTEWELNGCLVVAGVGLLTAILVTDPAMYWGRWVLVIASVVLIVLTAVVKARNRRRR